MCPCAVPQGHSYCSLTWRDDIEFVNNHINKRATKKQHPPTALCKSAVEGVGYPLFTLFSTVALERLRRRRLGLSRRSSGSAFSARRA